MKRNARVLFLVLVLALVCSGVAHGSTPYPDVPDDSWASADISAATAAGLMQGMDGGLFGYGREVTRAQFATLLCRLFGWQVITPDAASFSDVSTEEWFFSSVETALAQGALESAETFRPQQAVTRQEMAAMLVGGLGYRDLAGQVERFPQDDTLPFPDVTEQRGAISIAYDIGMVRGSDDGYFYPNHTAKREETAAMLLRVHRRLTSRTDWVHGFYAHASYSQRHLTRNMQAVSFGWSALTWDPTHGVSLDTTLSPGNEWGIPEGAHLITDYLETSGTAALLSVFMNTDTQAMAEDGSPSNTLRELLRSADSRAWAVEAILVEVTRPWPPAQRSPYDGVTIDFEGLTLFDRSNLTDFLTMLSAELRERGLRLQVAVHAALPDGSSYNGYDYRAIGQLADKLLLMAHNYSPADLDAYIGTRWHENTPVTPFASIYYALRAVTDEQTGVDDPSKVALAISFSPVAWQVDSEGLLQHGGPQYPTSQRVDQRMAQPDAQTFYSNRYRNASMTYTTEEGQHIFLWYEDPRSIQDKLALARLFGVTGVSVWRIGLIPEGATYRVPLLDGRQD